MAKTATQMTSQGILAKYEKMHQQAKAANEQRYTQGLGILDQAVSRYQPGGQFGQGAMAQFEQGKTQALAGGMQSLVNSGLSNTTVAAGLPLAYEQEVGTPFRLQLEDMRMGNLTEAERAKTGFIEARQDAYPDFGVFAQLAMQTANQPGRIISGDPNTWDPNGMFAELNKGGSSGSGSSGSMSSFLDSLGGGGSSGYSPGGTSGGSGLTQGSISPYSTFTSDGKTLSSGLSAPTAGGGSVGSGLGAGFGSTSSVATGGSMDEADYQALLQQNLQANPHYLTGQGAIDSTIPHYQPEMTDEDRKLMEMFNKAQTSGPTVQASKQTTAPKGQNLWDKFMAGTAGHFG